MPTLFERIIDRQIHADIVLENEHCVAFRDINPQAPVHVLVIPRRPIPSVSAAKPEDAALLGQVLLTAAEVARMLGIADSGYRLVFNNGEQAGQTVFHLHCHVLGGRDMRWPPG